MNYLVTTNYEKYKADFYKIISVEESLELLNKCKVLQADSETDGLNPHLKKLLCVQLGNDEYDIRVVIDCLTIDIKLYKQLLESTFCIFHNAKFDLQFFFHQGIIIRNLWDTMIVEQLLHLGWEKGSYSASLYSVTYNRLKEKMDKSIRETISTRGLDDKVIKYAINDVIYLEKIASSQKRDLISNNMLNAGIFESLIVPSIAYMEWCGIKLDEKKWKAKMNKDENNFKNSIKALNNFVTSNPSLSKYTYIPIHQDLFEEVDFSPKCTINWASSRQVIQLAKDLGFNTNYVDPKTKKEKESVLENHIKAQKGINDEFIDLYFKYKEYEKVVSSFGQSFIDSINPVTGRNHTCYQQLGAKSGRMSCGNIKDPDDELALYKHLPKGSCKKQNYQQLPSDHDTRASFISEEGNLFYSSDFSA